MTLSLVHNILIQITMFTGQDKTELGSNFNHSVEKVVKSFYILLRYVEISEMSKLILNSSIPTPTYYLIARSPAWHILKFLQIFNQFTHCQCTISKINESCAK